jgi:hypothetical protein
MRGAPPEWVQKRLGYESQGTILRYYPHWIPKESRGKYAELLDHRPITQGKRRTGLIGQDIGSPASFWTDARISKSFRMNEWGLTLRPLIRRSRRREGE